MGLIRAVVSIGSSGSGSNFVALGSEGSSDMLSNIGPCTKNKNNWGCARHVSDGYKDKK